MNMASLRLYNYYTVQQVHQLCYFQTCNWMIQPTIRGIHLNSLKPVRRRVSCCIKALNHKALFSFLELKIQECIHFIHGTSEICWKNVDFQNFMEIPVVILFATMFVVTDLTFIVTICEFKTVFEEIRLPSSFTSCLGLFTHDGPHFVVPDIC